MRHAVVPQPTEQGAGRHREPEPNQWPVLLVIAVGGGLGALARFGLTQLVPTTPGRIPWVTFTTNVSGCLLIGVLMVVTTEKWTTPLARPFLGVGVLGGFTTFSTFALEFRELLESGAAAVAFAYLGATLVATMLAVLAGTALTRSVFEYRRRR